MTNTDQHIRDLFANKLREAEAPVGEHLWSAIQTQLPAAGASAGGTATAAKFTWVKWLAGTAAAVGTVATVVVLSTSEPAPVASLSGTGAETGQLAETASEQPSGERDAGQAILTSPASNGAASIQTAEVHPADVGSIDEPTAPALQPTSAVGTTPSASKEENPTTSGPTVSPGPSAPSADLPVSGVEEGSALSAAFSVAPVDPTSLRWFFFPASESPANVQWDMGDGTTYTTLSPGHSYADEGMYTVRLTVSDQQGRTVTEEKVVKVYYPAALNRQNVFTPNGDGDNDVFDLLNTSVNVVHFERLMIFSPKGDVVLDSTTGSWDGNDRGGNPAESGHYRYVARFTDKNGDTLERRGTVQLLR